MKNQGRFFLLISALLLGSSFLFSVPQSGKNQGLDAGNVQAEPHKMEVFSFADESQVADPAKFKIGLYFSYSYITAKGFDGLYGRALGPGIEFSYLVSPKIDIWISVSSSGKEIDLGFMEGTSKYKMIPLAAGIKYHLMQKEKGSVFMGGGVNYIIFEDTSPLNEIKENVLGFNILGGGHFKLFNNFYGQMMLKFNSAKKTLDLIPAPDFSLNLTNFEFTIGAFFSF